jgi:phosphatidylethanolamine-binding protein (PEBP) family uncharacterized protein
MAFAIRSSGFAPRSEIPRKHTGEGADVSPPLQWEDPPAGTKGFALRSQPGLQPGLTKGACLKAIQGQVIATTECFGTYRR